ncbi:hypothetical protein FRB94_002635 [Tulasnella sp. JGI-2019a]|nr:hypothetical protein FRB94_002635 [Tulasnella sp. JGI-2019a]
MTIPGGASGWLAHETGARHQRLATAAAGPGLGPDQPVVPTPLPLFFCDACQLKFKDQIALDSHASTPSHHDKMRRVALRATVKDAQSNKFGVIIADTAGIDLGIIPVDHWAHNRALVIKVSSASLRLASVSFSTTMFSLTPGYALPIPLNSGKPFALSIDFNARKQLGLRGHFNDRAELRFENTTLQQSFTIVRRVKAIIGSKADYELLKAKAPFARPKRRRLRPNGRPVPGPRRSIRSNIPYVRIPPKYRHDKAVIVAGQEEERTQIIRAMLPPTLDADTYARHWHTLIHVEEGQMLQDIEVYDMIDTILHPMGYLF